MPVLWANQIKYLGLYVIGSKYVKANTSTMRRNIFASVNGILSKCPTASDITKLFKIKSNQNMFNHSIKIVQMHKKTKQMYKIKLAQEFNYTTEHNKVYMLPNNKTYKHYFIA